MRSVEAGHRLCRSTKSHTCLFIRFWSLHSLCGHLSGVTGVRHEQAEFLSDRKPIANCWNKMSVIYRKVDL